jgi:UDP-3-O-[3-hydroxymyristoyl] glucosamine N-acyltransferase
VRLSELPIAPPRRLERDGSFSGLGFVEHEGAGLLVALYQGRYLEAVLRSPSIAAVVTTEAFAASLPERFGVLLDPDPRDALYDIHTWLVRETDFYGPSRPSEIEASARIHPRAWVAPQDVTIGADVLVEPHATVLPGSHLAAGVVVRAGSVIGAEGFGARRSGGRLIPVPHAGKVVLEEGVQILSNCTVVRATFGGATVIGAETVLNAQSYVAHNVRIGPRCLIAAGALIAGSATIGAEAWIGPNAVISNSVRIGERARVSIGAVVVRDVAAGQQVSGHFAMPHREFLAFLARGRPG